MTGDFSQRRFIPRFRQPAFGRVAPVAAVALAFLACAIWTLVALQPALAAVQIDTAVSPQRGSVDEVFVLRVTVKDASGEIRGPSFKQSDQFTLDAVGTSQRKQYINGAFSAEVTFSFQVSFNTPLAPGTYKLPDGVVEVDGSEYRIDSPHIEITQASAAPAAPGGSANDHGVASAGGAVSFAQVVDNETPYVGEQVLYRAEVASTDQFLGGNLDDVEPIGFWRERPAKPHDQSQRNVGNVTVRSFVEILFPTKAGEITIPPRKLQARIRTRSRRRDRFGFDPGFGNFPFFAMERSYQRVLTAPGVNLEVKPLPPPPAGAASYIPVGSVKARSSLNPKTVKQGESTTLTVTLWGDANLRPFELPSDFLGKDSGFRRYDDKPNLRTGFRDGKLIMYKTFRIDLVALRAGELEIPPLTIVSFNPESEKYEAKSLAKKVVTVLPGEGEQRLNTTPLPPPADRAQDLEPNEITLVGEDLLPQHTGPETLNRRREMSTHTLWAMLLLFSTLALYGRRRIDRRLAALSDPHLALERDAYMLARDDLGRLNRSAASDGYPQQLRTIFSAYLSRRLRSRAESMTAKESGSLVESATGRSELGTEVERYLEQIERLVYSGGHTPQNGSNTIAELAETGAALISDIEQSLKTRGRKWLRA